MKRIGFTLIFLALVKFAYGQADASSLGILAPEISESSGLLFYNKSLITHNDSGNEPILYVVDTLSLAITRTVILSNAVNTDWEDIAMDERYIYVADIGNNAGNRTDLGIYRVSKQEFDTSETILAERISYSYEDQSDFSGSTNSDWDAEALIVMEDNLIVFTKQWQSNGTVAYSIPKNPGNHLAVRLETFPSNGLVTGATHNALSQEVFLCGYSQQLIPFVIRIEGVQQNFTFGSDTMRSTLPLGFAQVEAITAAGPNTYYLSSEAFVNASPPISLEPQLYKFTTEEAEPPDPPADPPIEPMPVPELVPDVIVYQTAGSNILSYEIGLEKTLYGRALFDLTGRQLQYTPAQEIQENEVNLATFGSAIYYISFYFDGQIVSKAFYKR